MANAGRPMPRNHTNGVVALFVAIALVASVTMAWRYTHPSTAYRNVAIVGDSITLLSTPLTHEQLDQSFSVNVSGVNGARADERVDDLAPLIAPRPNQLVINLGTNDVMQSTPPDQTTKAITAIASKFTDARCVHLVTVSQSIVSFTDPEANNRSARLNQRIHELAQQRGWHVIEWDRIVRDYGAAGEPKGPMTLDSIHPSPVGQQMLIDAYDQALERC